MQRTKLLVYCGLAGMLALGAAERPGTGNAAVSRKSAEASQALSSPALGFVNGQTPSDARAIVGVPGSTLLSDPVGIFDGFAKVRFAPGHAYALVESGSQDPAAIRIGSDFTVDPVPLPGGIPASDLVAFSPSAKALVLYSAGLGVAQIWSGLPGTPQLAWQTAVGPVSLLALSDDAATLIAGTSDGTVSTLAAGATPRVAYAASDLAAIAFLPNSADALVCDRQSASLILLHSSADGVSAQTVFAGIAGLGDSVGLNASADGASAFLTASAANRIFWINLAAGTAQPFDVPVKPVTLDPLRLPDTFLLSAQPGDPAWIFAREGTGARVVFVPALAQANSQ